MREYSRGEELLLTVLAWPSRALLRAWAWCTAELGDDARRGFGLGVGFTIAVASGLLVAKAIRLLAAWMTT